MGEAKRRRDSLSSAAPTTYQDMATGEVRPGFRTCSATAWLNSFFALCRDGEAGRRAESTVPCGTCNNCCYHSKVDVDPKEERPEDVARLQLVPDPDGSGLQLKRNDDGSCVHLLDGKCSVRAHRPKACRTYDCRSLSLAGFTDSFAGNRHSPVWIFSPGDEEDRILRMAMQMGGWSYAQEQKNKGEELSGGDAFGAALFNLQKNMDLCRKILDKFKTLPEDVREQIMSEIGVAGKVFAKALEGN